jgi:hypothetical protein
MENTEAEAIVGTAVGPGEHSAGGQGTFVSSCDYDVDLGFISTLNTRWTYRDAALYTDEWIDAYPNEERPDVAGYRTKYDGSNESMGLLSVWPDEHSHITVTLLGDEFSGDYLQTVTELAELMLPRL